MQGFYEDLFEAVESLAGRNASLDIGFGDFKEPGAERDAEIDRAVGAARVFVPLYSPEYADSPPRDREVFLDRLRTAADGKTGNVQPVLWVPLPDGRPFPDLTGALDLASDLPEYSAYGLSAMCRLKAHAGNYRTVVRRLAERIVETAELSVPVTGSSRPPVEFQTPPPAAISFVVAVVAPTESRLPPGRPAAYYGVRSTSWHPFRNRQELSVADYAALVARRLMMPTRVVDFASSDNRLETSPGLILVDPWVLAHDEGRAIVRAAFEALRRWVTLVVIVNRHDPQYEAGLALATQVMRMGASVTNQRVIKEAQEFEQQIMRMIGRTRRHYLNRPPGDESGP
ncbi:FxsC protein [Phytohabitans suffuscus]|uniref:FxsC protein n=1 Tax=Phytohabitans suffuscus TaxID=624315 RepID=UPI001566D1EF|nr:FxsC protein [Phytohabitans suffuscus]